jgi:carbonic anhydrase/acetyltransferase-like protein (isoleucine patch superfamily)
MRKALDSLYRRTRGVDAGIDPAWTSTELAANLARRSVQLLAAGVRGFPGAMISPTVKIRGRSYLSLGWQVVLNDFVTIDAVSKEGVHLHDRATVDQYAVLRGSGVIRNLGTGITVGARSAVGAFNVLLGQGGISIGEDCLLAPHVTVVSENHKYDNAGETIRTQGETRARTTIGNDVWIGAGAVILGGACIGDGAVVAAGAVVRGNVEPFDIVGGVPARVIGRRGA